MHLIPAPGIPRDGIDITVGDKVEVLEFDETRRAEWRLLHGSDGSLLF